MSDLFQLTPPQPRHPRKHLFDAFVCICEACGITEQRARQFLGKQLRDHPAKAVGEAIGAMAMHCPAEPFAYLIATLQQRPDNVSWEEADLKKRAAELGIEPAKMGESLRAFRERVIAAGE